MTLYLLGLLCSNYTARVLQVINPTINYQVGDVAKVPVVLCEEKKAIIEEIVERTISFSKTDWDSFETSWDFKKHPLI